MTPEEGRSRWTQLAGLIGAGVATACCLGLSAVLSVATALGAGFLLHDQILFPLFTLFIAFSLWSLRVAVRHHGYQPPFWLGVAGATIATVSLWLLVTGWWPHPWVLYLGLAGLVGASLWDLVRARMLPSCAPVACATEQGRGPSWKKGAAIAAAVGVAFVAGYESVKLATPTAAEADVRCFGINSCKATTACSTKWNACNGQNACKGKGWLYVRSERECRQVGGVLLEESPAAPA